MLNPVMRNIILIALALFTTAAAAEVYSWKDADGKTHFSDKPPAGREPSSLKTLELPSSEANTPRQIPAQSEKPTVAPADKTQADKDKAAADSKRASCEKARADLQALYETPRRTAVSKGGKFYALDGEERSTEEAALQKLIEDNCR